MAQNDIDFLFKILIIGDSAVGKSSLLLRFADDEYRSSYISTIGVDFKVKTVDINDKKVKLQMWDTAGQERFRTITSAYYKGANGILLVFGYDDKDSFDHIKSWLEQIKSNASDDVQILLIGNKNDLNASEKKVTDEEAQHEADERGLKFISTSAAQDNNVEESFTEMAKIIMEKFPDKEIGKSEKGNSAADLVGKKDKKSDGCC
eukprot:GAHX01000701.1.p1 GENE.GAHX01000701.1~~GAHX01000701.1.p1  ORF type:complete len:220 (-),score=53.82 GAHX01000701.1:62-676(-)